MKEKFTHGPWKVFIDDTGGELTGWPISIGAANEEDKSIVRPGGHYPYEWDAAMSQTEAVANAHLIAAAPEIYKALDAAKNALRSYQYGNASPELAEAIADMADKALAKAGGRS